MVKLDLCPLVTASVDSNLKVVQSGYEAPLMEWEVGQRLVRGSTAIVFVMYSWIWGSMGYVRKVQAEQ